MIVAIVYQHCERPMNQRRSQNQIVAHSVAGHILHFGAKSAGRPHHSDGLLCAGRKLQSNRIADVSAANLLDVGRNVKTPIVAESHQIARGVAVIARSRRLSNDLGNHET